MAASCTSTRYAGPRLEAVQASPQWRDGRFHNALERRDGSLFEIMRESFRSPDHTVPAGELPVRTLVADDFAEAPASALRATWLGHSTVLLEIDGQRVLTDPVWSDRATPVSWVGPRRFFDPPLPLEALPPVDVVVISHDHYDHLDKRTIQALGARVPLFAVPLGVGAHLESWGVAPERIVELDWWGEVRVGALTLTATPARHFSGRSLTSIYSNDTLWSGWAIVGPAHRAYYSGDTGMFPGFTEIGERLGPFDLTLIEAGAYDALWPDVHLGPEQAVQAHRMVQGRLLMPVHWGTFNLANHGWTEPAERVWAESRRRDVAVALPRPGEQVEPSAPPGVVRWWPELPWETAEEAPVVSTGLAPVVTQPGT